MYKVKVNFGNDSFEEHFDDVKLDSVREYLFLFSNFVTEDGQKQLERWTIPLNAIDSLEITPREDK